MGRFSSIQSNPFCFCCEMDCYFVNFVCLRDRCGCVRAFLVVCLFGLIGLMLTRCKLFKDARQMIVHDLLSMKNVWEGTLSVPTVM